jgi:ribosomal protein L3 glutamine methyltransferase
MAEAEELERTLLTVRDWLRYAVSRFTAAGLVYGHGTASALDEAAYLILHTLHLPIDQLEPWLDARLTLAERQALGAIIAKRISTRKPAPYLTNEAWVQGHAFYVDERVIVPRSYIGELLGSGLSAVVADAEDVGRVLDLCTGSGCLAILAALAFPNAVVDASDVSADALAVAERNVATYELGDRVSLVRSDLFAKLAGRTYDLILSNPPYVSAEAVVAFPPEYAAEPKIAGDRDRHRSRHPRSRVSAPAVPVAGYRGDRGRGVCARRHRPPRHGRVIGRAVCLLRASLGHAAGA